MTKETVCNCWILVDCLDANRWNISLLGQSLLPLLGCFSTSRFSSWFLVIHDFLGLSKCYNTNVVRTCLTKCLFIDNVYGHYLRFILIGASVSEPLLVMLTGASHIYIYIYYYYYVSYVVPHILNLSNLTHVTSIKYV